MTWTLAHNSTLHIVELVFAGSTTGPDLREATVQGIALGKEQGILDYFVDATEIQLHNVSTFDLYDLPNMQYVKEGLDRRSRVAFVMPKLPKEKKDAEFYEIACANRGWHVRSFPNRDKAIEWLTGSNLSDKPQD